MVNKNYKKLSLFQNPVGFLCGTMLFLLFSCASVPKPENFYAGRNSFGLMAEGADLYLTAEVQSVRPILDSLKLGGMSGTELKQFLDMSDILTLAVFQVPGKRHFYGAASGKFPSTSGGLFFSASKDWEKMVSGSGMPYWYSERSKLAVSIGAKAAYFSDGDPFVASPGALVPDALPALQKNSLLSGWMNNPSPAINKLIASFEIPIEIPAERLLFAVFGAEQEPAKSKKDEDREYYAILRFETPTTTQASALVRIFTMARLGLALSDFGEHKEMEALAKAFFSQNPRQDGSSLILETGKMNGNDLALLFNSISVY